MTEHEHCPLTQYQEYPVDQMLDRSKAFYDRMKMRRSVRSFSDRPLPREIIENCIRAAGTAPSGANMQPWHFVVVSDRDVKQRIHAEAERVETDFYHRRAPGYWLEALASLGTNEHKEYLEKAPYLIVVFSQRHTVDPDGSVRKNYYLAESVGIATGILITAVHNAGLVCLTHTPSPMSFLREVLGRPKYETPYLILVVGYPEKEATVPIITKKSLAEIATFV